MPPEPGEERLVVDHILPGAYGIILVAATAASSIASSDPACRSSATGYRRPPSVGETCSRKRSARSACTRG